MGQGGGASPLLHGKVNESKRTKDETTPEEDSQW